MVSPSLLEFAMSLVKILAVAMFLGLFASLGSAEVLPTAHDYYETDPSQVTGTGANEAAAQVVAEAALDAWVVGFEAGLPANESMVSVVETHSWDGTTYTIDFYAVVLVNPRHEAYI